MLSYTLDSRTPPVRCCAGRCPCRRRLAQHPCTCGPRASLRIHGPHPPGSPSPGPIGGTHRRTDPQFSSSHDEDPAQRLVRHPIGSGHYGRSASSRARSYAPAFVGPCAIDQPFGSAQTIGHVRQGPRRECPSLQSIWPPPGGHGSADMVFACTRFDPNLGILDTFDPQQVARLVTSPWPPTLAYATFHCASGAAESHPCPAEAGGSMAQHLWRSVFGAGSPKSKAYLPTNRSRAYCWRLHIISQFLMERPGHSLPRAPSSFWATLPQTEYPVPPHTLPLFLPIAMEPDGHLS